MENDDAHHLARVDAHVEREEHDGHVVYADDKED